VVGMSKHYTIMSSRHCQSATQFERLVDSMLKDGWVLQGGVSVVHEYGKPVLYQAMYLEVVPPSTMPSLPTTPIRDIFDI